MEDIDIDGPTKKTATSDEPDERRAGADQTEE
jgi:hypothetical protein